MRTENEKGVSPVIATILLIALTVVAVGIVAAFMGTISLGGVTLESWTQSSVRLKNSGADLDKSNLRLLVDDEIVLDPIGTGTWSTGQGLTISIPAAYQPLTPDNTIKLINKLTAQILLERKLS